jgi:AcrR family transcriptional regulator
VGGDRGRGDGHGRAQTPERVEARSRPETRDRAETRGQAPRRQRSDAQRNVDALREAAKAVFAESGVDAPVREIADRAGVGLGTVYRHFPLRSDLITAVFKHEMDACADAAPVLAADHDPGEALRLWLERYTDFIATKRGLAAALHSGDPAFEALPAYFQDRLVPALGSLLDAAVAAGRVRGGADPYDLLTAVANLCVPAAGDPAHVRRMVALLLDGLRYGASSPGRDG